MLVAMSGSLGGAQDDGGQLLLWPCCGKASAPAHICLEQLAQLRDDTWLLLQV